MALNSKFLVSAVLAMVIACGTACIALAQVRPYRASPVCGPQCGTPLTGPCVTATPYGYVPTSWRRWPVTQASATMAPEELPLPTPATAPKPPADELPLDDEVPQLPMTPDLPLGDVPGEVNAPSQQTPSSDTQILPPSGQPQVPVFGDEPQAPPSAAGPGATPFGDEPPQPPADEEPLPTEPIPTEAPANLAPEQAPAATPGQGQPGTNMPFDVGPSPTMPAEDPFKDDPDQGLFEPQSGTRLEQSPTDRYGLNRPVPADDSNFEPTYAVEQSQPRLLRADGGSLEATRLPEASPGDNPLRQVSHPVRRTAATQGELPNTAPKTWRRNPLRDR